MKFTGASEAYSPPTVLRAFLSRTSYNFKTTLLSNNTTLITYQLKPIKPSIAYPFQITNPCSGYKKDIELYPDAYQYERTARLGVSAMGIWHALRRLGVTYKKTLKHPKSDPAKRSTHCQQIADYECQGRPLVFIDESGFAHDGSLIIILPYLTMLPAHSQAY